MGSRRKFITDMALGGVGAPWLLHRYTLNINWNTDDWTDIRKLFPTSDNDLVNLNSGSAGTMPIPVLKDYLMLTRTYNNNALYRMHQAHGDQATSAATSLASFMDCDRDELAFTKNTTESLNAVIWGFPFAKGDEALLSDADYPYAVTAFNQRAQREGIKLNMISLRPHRMTDQDIIDAYENAITDRTKLMLVTMVTHREGQVLPVGKIIDMAHRYGVEVLVDGAHALAHFPHSIRSLNCDYYASCMHKWLNGPHGNGVLYVRKDHVPKLHPPAFPYPEDMQDSMKKFDYSGTVAFQKLATLAPVMQFNESIDIRKKEARLKYLTDYWSKKIGDFEGVEIIHDPERSVAMGGFNIGGRAPERIRQSLYEKHRINIKKTGYPELPFYRVSVNIFTNEEDLDRFASALKQEIEN